MNSESTNTEAVSASVQSQSAGDIAAEPAVNADRKKMVKRVGAGLIVLVLVLALAVPYIFHALSYESTDDAFIDGDIVPVSPRVAGHVSRVTVSANRWVKAGDLLVELDARDYEARLDAAKAALESATAADRARQLGVELTRITATSELDEAQNKVESAKAAVQEATARQAMSRAALEQAENQATSADAEHQSKMADLKRCREMAETQTISSQDLDHAVTAEQIAAAALAAAQKNISVRKAAVDEAGAALKIAEADLRIANARLTEAQSAPQRIEQSRSQADQSGSDVDRARADMIQAQLNLSYTKIVAPCDGFVTRKNVEPGQFVQVGQSLMAIVPHEVWVIANFKETQLTHMKPGQPARIKVDAYPNREFEGHVDSIQHGTGARFSLLPPENATGNYVKVTQRVPVKIVFDQPEKDIHVLLSPGMSVVPDVNVKAGGRQDGNPQEHSTGKNTPEAKNN